MVDILLIFKQVGIKSLSNSIFLLISIFLIFAIGNSSSSGVELPKMPSFNLKLARSKSFSLV